MFHGCVRISMYDILIKFYSTCTKSNKIIVTFSDLRNNCAVTHAHGMNVCEYW